MIWYCQSSRKIKTTPHDPGVPVVRCSFLFYKKLRIPPLNMFIIIDKARTGGQVCQPALNQSMLLNLVLNLKPSSVKPSVMNIAAATTAWITLLGVLASEASQPFIMAFATR